MLHCNALFFQGASYGVDFLNKYKQFLIHTCRPGMTVHFFFVDPMTFFDLVCVFRYVLKKSEINIATLARPILRRKENMTFRDWIGTFCAVLMQMVSCQKCV